MKVLVAPITAHYLSMLLCPAMQNSARKRDSVKATFVGTRLIVQTNVAAALYFCCNKKTRTLLSLIGRMRHIMARELLRHVGDILYRHFGNDVEKPLGPEETR